MGMTAGGETVSAVFDLFRGLFKFVAGDLRPVIRDILKLHHHGKLRVGEIRQHRGPYLAFAYLTVVFTVNNDRRSLLLPIAIRLTPITSLMS